MEPFHTQRCEQCSSDSPALDNEKSHKLLNRIPGWKIEVHSGVHRLVKTFEFNSFKEAFEFAERVAAIAEQENHHPVITIGWGRTVVQWWTHSIAGIHLNDFIMAAKTQQAADEKQE